MELFMLSNCSNLIYIQYHAAFLVISVKYTLEMRSTTRLELTEAQRRELEKGYRLGVKHSRPRGCSFRPTRPRGCSYRTAGLDLQSRPIEYKDFQSAGQQCTEPE